MRSDFLWILLLISSCVPIKARSLTHQGDKDADLNHDYNNYNAHNIPKSDDSSHQPNEQVISVRITSSIAVDRGRGKPNHRSLTNEHYFNTGIDSSAQMDVVTESLALTTKEDFDDVSKNLPPSLAGANIEFIKQLNLKKNLRSHQLDQVHPYKNNFRNNFYNDTEDSVAEPSIKSVTNLDNNYEVVEEIDEDVPLARSIPLSPPSKNFVQNIVQKGSDRESNVKLTTVNFNIVHASPKTVDYNNEQSNKFKPPSNSYANTPIVYSEPEKVYSEPAKVYSEPAKFYSEPAKIYSEPAKIYSEPAKIYSEPAKIYSVPSKFYSEPASLHLTPKIVPSRTTWQPSITVSTADIASTTPSTAITDSVTFSNNLSSKVPTDHIPEKNYEIDEKVSVRTDGRTHGVQESSTENCKQDNCKVGYVVEGRQYRKYRVEERTPDGFIVGEYGVVRNEDGALRGVRYTADSEASPRLIYDALMKFLQL